MSGNGTNGTPVPLLEMADTELFAKRDKLRAAAEIQLLESLFWDWNGFDGADTLNRVIQQRWGSDGAGGWIPPATLTDRKDGRKWPVWSNPTELLALVAQSRIAYETNPYATGYINRLVDYTIGLGFSYQAQPYKPRDVSGKPGVQVAPEVQRLVSQVQNWLDDWLAANRWSSSCLPNHDLTVIGASREEEAAVRLWVDGDTTFRLYNLGDGQSAVRFVDATQIMDPPGAQTDEGWSLGIKHRVEPFVDMETVEAIHVRGLTENDDEIVSGEDIVRLLPRGESAVVKRGTPLLSFGLLEALNRALKLQANASKSAAWRAATAEIWKHTTGTQANITSLAQALGGSTTDPDGRARTFERIVAPAVRRGSSGMEPVTPTSVGYTDYLSVGQGDLRQAGVTTGTPEFMISGDASNNNFASIKESGTPFVVASAVTQNHFKAAFLLVIRKAMRIAVAAGVLPREALKLVEIQAEASKDDTRTPLERAQEDQILLGTKIKSRKTAQLERNLDPDHEDSNIEEDEQRFGNQGQPLGLDGGGDGPDDGGGGSLADLFGGGQQPPGGVSPTPESLMESALLEAGFTGTLTDSLGRKRHYVDGKQVAQAKDEPKATPEQRADAKAARGKAVDDAHAGIKKALAGDRTPEHAKALVEHLATLTVAQLHAIRKEYQLSASGPLKEVLVRKLADRLARGRSEDIGVDPSPQTVSGKDEPQGAQVFRDWADSAKEWDRVAQEKYKQSAAADDARVQAAKKLSDAELSDIAATDKSFRIREIASQELASRRKPFRIERDEEGNVRAVLTDKEGAEHRGKWRTDSGQNENELVGKAIQEHAAKLGIEDSRQSYGSHAEATAAGKVIDQKKRDLLDHLTGGKAGDVIADFESANGGRRKYTIEPRYDRAYGIRFVGVNDHNGEKSDITPPHESYEDAATDVGTHLSNVRDPHDLQIHHEKTRSRYEGIKEEKRKANDAEHQKKQKEDAERHSANIRSEQARQRLNEQVSKIKATKGSINISTNAGPQSVSGYRVGEFFIHKSERESAWDVSHARSGVKATSMPNMNDAKLAASALQSQGDWSFTDSKNMNSQTYEHGRAVAKMLRNRDWAGIENAMNRQGRPDSAARIESVEVLESGFTGVKTDSLGRKQYYRDGKHVKGNASNATPPSPAVSGVAAEAQKHIRTIKPVNQQAVAGKPGDAARPNSEGLASVEQQTLTRAKEQYKDLKDRYLAKDDLATRNSEGDLVGVTLNTDEWRDLFPEYKGTNASDVHEASSYANKKLLAESMEAMKGKGNNRFLILAGGGGSGKGTATKQYLDQSEYPIRLDQVSDNLKKLNDKIDEAKAAGFTPDYVFIDRHPADAWKQGVVKRALSAREKGELARTVPLEIALKANLDSRKVAIEVLKTRLDIPVRVIDNNHGLTNARLITDRSQAIHFLESQNHDHDQLLKELRDDTHRLYERGKIPADIAAGLIPERPVVH